MPGVRAYMIDRTHANMTPCIHMQMQLTQEKLQWLAELVAEWASKSTAERERTGLSHWPVTLYASSQNQEVSVQSD